MLLPISATEKTWKLLANVGFWPRREALAHCAVHVGDRRVQKRPRPSALAVIVSKRRQFWRSSGGAQSQSSKHFQFPQILAIAVGNVSLIERPGSGIGEAGRLDRVKNLSDRVKHFLTKSPSAPQICRIHVAPITALDGVDDTASLRASRPVETAATCGIMIGARARSQVACLPTREDQLRCRAKVGCQFVCLHETVPRRESERRCWVRLPRRPAEDYRRDSVARTRPCAAQSRSR